MNNNYEELAKFLEHLAGIYPYYAASLNQCAQALRDAQNVREGALREVLALPRYLAKRGYTVTENTCVLVKDIEALLTKQEAEAVKGETDDLSRCAICGWPLAESQEKGCMRGDCSMRPFPERFYSPERVYIEYRGLVVPRSR